MQEINEEIQEISQSESAITAPAIITKASGKKKEPVKKQSKSRLKQLKALKELSSKSNQNVSNSQKTGFDGGLKAEYIIGATDEAGTLMYLIKWKGRNEASLVDSKIAHAKCPAVVADFLSKKITYQNDTENQE